MTTSTTGRNTDGRAGTDGLDAAATDDLTPGQEHGGNGVRPAPGQVDATEPSSPEPVEAALAVVRSSVPVS